MVAREAERLAKVADLHSKHAAGEMPADVLKLFLKMVDMGYPDLPAGIAARNRMMAAYYEKQGLPVPDHYKTAWVDI